tara:strand:- start:11 stop:193 length:183 start_codon:yes stop_codon:yes gene_type:complete
MQEEVVVLLEVGPQDLVEPVVVELVVLQVVLVVEQLTLVVVEVEQDLITLMQERVVRVSW